MSAETEAGERRVLTVYYDGECKLCLTAVSRLRRSRTRSELRFVPLQAVPPGSLGDAPEEPGGADGHLSQMLVKDESSGRLVGGSDAVTLLLRDVPGLAWIGRLGALPGFRLLAAAAYRLVAKYRYRLFGKSDACQDGSCRIVAEDQDGLHGGST